MDNDDNSPEKDGEKEKLIPEIQVQSVDGKTDKTKKSTKADEIDVDKYIPKTWNKAPGQSCGEKCDMCCFKCIFYFPVVVTFVIFTFLIVFYVYVSLLYSI